jgi:hypothetical protein
MCAVFFSVFMFACSDGGDDPPSVQPTFSSLWVNIFFGCGVNCHRPSAADFTELGPDLSSKANFYVNVVGKSVNNDYLDWAVPKGGDCNDVNFITPNNANESTLAAALILSISDSLAGVHNCTTTYSYHDGINQEITNNALKNALITWINNGAKNN